MAKILLPAGKDRPFLLRLFHPMARVEEVQPRKWPDVNFTGKVSLPVLSRLPRPKSLPPTDIYLQAIDPNFRGAMWLPEGILWGFCRRWTRKTCSGNLLTVSPKKKGFKFLNLKPSILLVPKRGFEPRRGHPHWTLNPARLPVPPLRLMACNCLAFFIIFIYNNIIGLSRTRDG